MSRTPKRKDSMTVAEFQKLGPVDDLIELISRENLPVPEREYRFREDRRFAFDLCWLNRKLAVEVEGGIWSEGRHTRGIGYEKDCEKYSLAAIDGWAVIRVTPGMIKSGQAMDLISQAFFHREVFRTLQAGDDPPERIYLQLGSDYEKGDKVDWSEVTWCADEIENSDIEYRLVKRKRKRLI